MGVNGTEHKLCASNQAVRSCNNIGIQLLVEMELGYWMLDIGIASYVIWIC
jgi:hypothetical protein